MGFGPALPGVKQECCLLEGLPCPNMLSVVLTVIPAMTNCSTYWGDHPQFFTAIPASSEPQGMVPDFDLMLNSSFFGAFY
jgi:hypothetical protein